MDPLRVIQKNQERRDLNEWKTRSPFMNHVIVHLAHDRFQNSALCSGEDLTDAHEFVGHPNLEHRQCQACLKVALSPSSTPS